MSLLSKLRRKAEVQQMSDEERKLMGLNKMARGLGLPQRRSLFLGDKQMAQDYERVTQSFAKPKAEPLRLTLTPAQKFTFNGPSLNIQFPEIDQVKLRKSTGPVIRPVKTFGSDWFGEM